jgi:tRNA (guanine37-N1)-methyltransferase
MVMRFDILAKAVNDILQRCELSKNVHLIFTSASGQKFNQQLALKFADQLETQSEKDDEQSDLIFICGRFEGYDARAVEYFERTLGESHVFELSIGDYVLFGGEVAVLVMCEAIIRLLPNVLGNPESLVEESHSQSEELFLEYPQYTRPQSFEGLGVPEVLLSGNHSKIKLWRELQAQRRLEIRSKEREEKK